MMIEIVKRFGKEDIAIVNVATHGKKILEFVESVQPPIPRHKKWVLIISTLYGCPMKCLMCDAGEYYQGKISKDQILEQIDIMIKSRFPNRVINVEKLKIQFARMGEPTINNDVLKVLRELPKKYNAPGLMPCISTIAPRGCEKFLYELIKIKDEFYSNGKFQIQFSIHTTDKNLRKKLMPADIWSFKEIHNYGNRWYKENDRKITLNFAVSENPKINPEIISTIFDPEKYFIKLTPINPTYNAIANKLESGITPDNADHYQLAEKFRQLGFETLISIGSWEENQIGSNCGQFATKYLNENIQIKKSYNCNKYLI